MEQQRVELESSPAQRGPHPSRIAATPFERPFVAPRDETENQIARIWQSLLGRGKISVNANFFELGGHSLLAARLLARVEKALGTKLSLPVLFQAPTIAELAAVVRGQNPKATQLPVNALQPEGAKSPLFWVAGYSRFLALANRLGSDRPFYGLPLDDLSNLPVPYRMEDIAACMLKVIRQVQPEGPYFIGGWCIAGVIGYEIAQQLQQQGQEVALLVMIDAANPSYSRRLDKADAYDARLYFLSQKLRYHLRTMWQQGVRGAYFYAWERMKTLHFRFTRRIFRLCYELHLHAGFPLISALKDYNRVAQIALSGYYPKPYSGRVALVRSIARLAERYGARTLGWDELASTLHVVETPGDHTEMFEHPNVDVLAGKLRASMEGATKNPASSAHDPNKSTAGANPQRANSPINSALAGKHGFVV
jgi:thioesterase domain-containing protein/acyl carrier protein